MDKWITIKGRKLLCTEFMYILDDGRYCQTVTRIGSKGQTKYNTMICAIQELTMKYINGEDSIEDESEDFFKGYLMDMPKERKLPEALEELVTQLESKLFINLSELWDLCVVRSNDAYSKMLEKEKKEQDRIKLIQSLILKNQLCEYTGNEPVEDRIRNLLLLQKAKAASNQYKMNEKELNITRVWCDLLVSSIFSEVISYGLMLRLVANELVDEFEISDLLKNKYHIKKDYEWYSEDLIGCDLDDPTDIQFEDILELCTQRVEKVIGARI